tara:strand:- start:4132 stop:5109 length:978 start_codon:yes stop_codon:yes gene_type:complete
MNLLKLLLLFVFFLGLNACGDRDEGKVSKGHRDAIKEQCASSSDVKACGIQVRINFLEDGNEFVDLSELTKSEQKKIKLECMRAKSFGLLPYNDCLANLKEAAEEGDLWTQNIEPKPQDHIDKLQTLTVKVDIIEKGKDNKIYLIGSGSGVVIDQRKNIVATNCHVVMDATKPKTAIVLKKLDQSTYAVAKIYKTAEEHDICLLKKVEDSEFNFDMKAVKKLKKFSKLKKGQFVRTFGTPMDLEGHTARGEIQYLGTAGAAGRTSYGGYIIDGDTKIIEHSAKIAPGSSGGPLFDKDGHLIGLNTFGNVDFNFSVSSDHIKELLD